MNPSIFKAYDIRGVYPSEINEQAAYNIGRALVAYTKAKKVVVGKDKRNSSDSMEEKFVQGITDQGADVIKIGPSTTPMVYHASGKIEGVDVAAIITASHNPAEYNGFKFCHANAVPIGEGAGMEEIKEMALAGEFKDAEEKGKTEERPDFKEEYLDFIAGFFNKEKAQKKKIVFDFAGAMGIIDKGVIEKLGEWIEPVYILDEYDPEFSVHEANPLKPETLKMLQEKVKETGADLGMSVDGDGDRVGFVDENAEVIPMDYLTALIGKETLKKYPGGTILADLRSSDAVREVIQEAGGKIEDCRVGHTLIKKQMRETGAIFAGELSGHYFFEENFKAEMGALALVKLLNMLNETGQSMSGMVQELKRYSHSGEFNFIVEDKEGLFEILKEKYKEGELGTLDGIKLVFEDWWFNLRASNTEPKVRLNLEAKNKELMEEKFKEVSDLILTKGEPEKRD